MSAISDAQTGWHPGASAYAESREELCAKERKAWDAVRNGRYPDAVTPDLIPTADDVNFYFISPLDAIKLLAITTALHLREFQSDARAAAVTGRLAMLRSIETNGIEDISYAVSEEYYRRHKRSGALPPPSTDPDFLDAMDLRGQTFKSIGLRGKSLIAAVTGCLVADEDDADVVRALQKLRQIMEHTAEDLMDLGIVRIRHNIQDMTSVHKRMIKGYRWVIRIQAMLVAAATFKEAKSNGSHDISQWVADYRRDIGSALSMMAKYRKDHRQAPDEEINAGIIALRGQLDPEPGFLVPGTDAATSAARSRTSSPTGPRAPSPPTSPARAHYFAPLADSEGSSSRSPTPPPTRLRALTGALRAFSSTLRSVLPSFPRGSGSRTRARTASPTSSTATPTPPTATAHASRSSPFSAFTLLPSSSAAASLRSGSSGSESSENSEEPEQHEDRDPFTFAAFPSTLEELKICIDGKTSKATGAVIVESEAEKPFFTSEKSAVSSLPWDEGDRAAPDNYAIPGTRDGCGCRLLSWKSMNASADMVLVALASLSSVHLAFAHIDGWGARFFQSPKERKNAVLLLAGYINVFHRKALKIMFAWDLKKSIENLPCAAGEAAPEKGNAFEFLQHCWEQLMKPLFPAVVKSSQVKVCEEIRCSKCEHCEYTRKSSPFLTLPLAVKEKTTDGAERIMDDVDLFDVIDYWQSEKPMPADFACPDCGEEGVSFYKRKVESLGSIVIMHFTLEQLDEEPNRVGLPAGSWMMGGVLKCGSDKYMPTAYVLFHGDELHSGHHTAFVRPSPSTPWYYENQYTKRPAYWVAEEVLSNAAEPTVGRPIIAIFERQETTTSSFRFDDDPKHTGPVIIWTQTQNPTKSARCYLAPRPDDVPEAKRARTE